MWVLDFLFLVIFAGKFVVMEPGPAYFEKFMPLCPSIKLKWSLPYN